MNLLNPTSGRDASHPCLISLWPKEECTHQARVRGAFLWEDFCLGPQSSIVCFEISNDRPTSLSHEFAQSHIKERHLPSLPYKEDFRLSLQSSIVRSGIGKDRPSSLPHEFAQSHIGERRLPPLPYKPLA